MSGAPLYENIFNVENVAVFPFWLAMIVAPQQQVVKKVIENEVCVGVLDCTADDWCK